MKKSALFFFFITFSAISISAEANFISTYCPQKISCIIKKTNNHDTLESCSNLPSGWVYGGLIYSAGPEILDTGTYTFMFSFATYYSNSSAFYIAEKGQNVGIQLVNNQWRPEERGTNKWQSNGSEKYCYSKGLYYNEINNPLFCPFQV